MVENMKTNCLSDFLRSISGFQQNKSFRLDKTVKSFAKFFSMFLVYLAFNVSVSLLTNGVQLCPVVIFQALFETVRLVVIQSLGIVFTVFSNCGFYCLLTVASIVGFGVVLVVSRSVELHFATLGAVSYAQQCSEKVVSQHFVNSYKLHIQFLS